MREVHCDRLNKWLKSKLLVRWLALSLKQAGVMSATTLMMQAMIMGTLLGVDHALAPPTGRQARLGGPPKD